MSPFPIRRPDLQQQDAAVAEMNRQAQEQDFIAQQQKEQARMQQMQEEAAREAARAQKAALANAKRQGVKIAPDATGAETIQRHEDGQPVYEAGFVGQPQISDQGGAVTYRDARGQRYDVPFDAIRSEPDPTGETFYSFDVTSPDGQKQTMRQPAGAKPLFRVDPGTGSRIMDVTDPATGSVQPRVVGVDPLVANKAAIEKRKNAAQLAQNERSGAAEELRLQLAQKDTLLQPVRERLRAAQEAADKIAKDKTTYERAADGLYAVTKLSDDSMDPMRRKLVSPTEIARADSWLKSKDSADKALMEAKAAHDPAAAEIQTMQERRDALALETLKENRRAAAEIRRMEEAAKAGQDVTKPDWQQRAESLTRDAKLDDLAAVADLEAAGDPLAPDVQRAAMPDAAASINRMMSGMLNNGLDLLNAGLGAGSKSTLERAIADSPTMTQRNGQPATTDEARRIAAKSLGITDPASVEVTPNPLGHLELRYGDQEFASYEPDRNRITIMQTAGGLHERAADLIANADKDGVPVYLSNTYPNKAEQPFTAAELRDLLVQGVDAVKTADSPETAEAALAQAGLAPNDIRGMVRSGKLSVQDGRMMLDKFHGVEAVNYSRAAVQDGLGRFLASQKTAKADWDAGNKAAVISRYMDSLASKATSGVVVDRTILEQRRQELMSKHVKEGTASKVGGFLKELIMPMVGIGGQAVAYVPQKIAKWTGYETEAGRLSEQQFEDWQKRTGSFVNKMMSRDDVTNSLGELRSWAQTANPGDSPPDDLADKIAGVAYDGYHELTDDAAKALNTSRDTFNVKRDPMLRAALDRYLRTADPAAFDQLSSLLMLDGQDRKTQAEVSSYISAPRVASFGDVIGRAKGLNIDLTPDAAGKLVGISRVLARTEDQKAAQKLIAEAGKIMGLEGQEAAETLVRVTADETDDPDSAWGLLKGGFVAGRQELATEALFTGMEAGLAWVTAGAATPEIIAERAARQGIKTGIRAAIRRNAQAAFTKLADSSTAFAKTAAALGKARETVGTGLANMGEAFAKAGIKTPTFGQPLTRADKVRNAAVQVGKNAAAAAPMEGIEEGVAAIGEPDPNAASIGEQMLMGAAGGLVLTPMFAGAAAVGQAWKNRGAGAEWEKRKSGYIDELNRRMESVPGFKPLTVADFDAWQGLQDNPAQAQARQTMIDAMRGHEAAITEWFNANEGNPQAPLSPAVLAAQANVERAGKELELATSSAFMAMDELRGIPEAERPLYTGAAKAATGARDFTEAEAKALMAQGGNNAVVFQQAQAMPADVARPPAQRAVSAPAVSTVAPGVYRLPAGVRVDVPPALLDSLVQKAPTMVDLLRQPANQTPAVQAVVAKTDAKKQATPKAPKGKKTKNTAPPSREKAIQSRLSEIESQFGPRDTVTFGKDGKPETKPYRIATTEEQALLDELKQMQGKVQPPAQATPAETQAAAELSAQAPAMKALPKVAKKRSKLLATLKAKGVVVRVVNTAAEAEAVLGKKVSKGRKGVAQNVNGVPHVVLIGEQAENAMTDTLDHEAIHGLSLAFAAENPELHAAAMLAVDPASPEFDAALNEFMRREYNGYDKLSQRQKFEEALRAIVEGRWKGRTSAKSKGFKKFLKAFLAYVRSLMDGSQNAALKQIVANIETALQNEPNNQTPTPTQQDAGPIPVGTGNTTGTPTQQPAKPTPAPVAPEPGKPGSRETAQTTGQREPVTPSIETPIDNAPAPLPQDLDAKLAALTKGVSVSFSKAEKDTVNASWGEASPFNVPEAFKKGKTAKSARDLPMGSRIDDDSPVAKEEVLFIVEAIADAEMQRRNTLAKRRLVVIGSHVANDGGAGYFWDTDTVAVNPQRLARMVWAEMLNAGKAPTRRLVAEQARGVITHEIVHAAQFEAARLAYSKIKGDKPAFEEWVKGYYEAIWNSLDPEQQQATIAAYGTILANAPEWHRGAEASRMLLETGTMERMSEAIIRHLENVLAVLKRWYDDVVNGKADNAIVADEIERVQAVLDAWNSGGTVKSDAKQKPAKAKAQKPEAAQTSKPADSAPEISTSDQNVTNSQAIPPATTQTNANEKDQAKGQGQRQEVLTPANPETAPESALSNPDMSTGAVDGDAGDQALADAFSGLYSSPARLTQADLPKERRDAMMKAASVLVDVGVKTPLELAQRLEKLAPNGALRQYSRAFWRLMTGFDSTLEESPDWQAVYAEIDRPITQPTPNESLAAQVPEEGRLSVYPLRDRWLVQQSETRGFGDHIYDTEQEAIRAAIQQQNMEAENRRFQAEQKRRQQEQAAEAARVAATLTAYLDSLALNAMQRGKLKSALEPDVARQSSAKNKTYSGPRFLVAEEMVADGYRPQTEQVSAIKEPTRTQWNRMDNRQQAEFERRRKEAGTKTEYTLALPDGSAFVVTKAEHDYANWLSSRPPSVEGVTGPSSEQGAAPAAPPTSFPVSVARALMAMPYHSRTFPMGDRNAELRQQVLEVITGERPPKSKAGANAVREALRRFFNVSEDDTTAAIDENIQKALQAVIDAAEPSTPYTPAQQESDRVRRIESEQRVLEASAKADQAQQRREELLPRLGTGWQLSGNTISKNGFGHWTEQERDEVRQRFREAGIRSNVSAPDGNSTRKSSFTIQTLDASKLAEEIFAAEQTIRESERQQKIADEEKKTAQELAQIDSVALQWMTSLFQREDFANAYNKVRLSDFVTGKTAKFTGMVNPRWLDGAQAANAVLEGGKVDFAALKQHFEKFKAANSSSPAKAEVPERGDTVTWTDGAGKEAVAMVERIDDLDGVLVATVNWFGPKGVPLDQLTLKIKSSQRLNRERREAEAAAKAGIPTKEVTTPEPVKEKKPADNKALKEMKRFLLEKLDDAIAEAPDWDSGDNLSAQMTTLEGHREFLRQILRNAEAYTPAGIAKIKDRLGALIQLPETAGFAEYDKALGELINQEAARIRALRPKVIIEIPGDGTFTLLNDKKTLKEFAKIAKGFPTTTPSATYPKPTAIRSSSIPALNKAKLSKMDMVKVAGTFASTDETRMNIMQVVDVGDTLVATNGKYLFMAPFEGQGTAENPMLYTAKGGQIGPQSKHEADFGAFPANWRQVIPADTQVLHTGIDTGRLWQILKQASAVFRDVNFQVKNGSGTFDDAVPYVDLFLNPDGSVAVVGEVENGKVGRKDNVDRYEHNLQEGAQSIGRFNADLFMDILAAMRALGQEKVSFRSEADMNQGAFVVSSPVADVILMRVRTQAATTAANVEAAQEAMTPAEQTAAAPVDWPTESRNLTLADTARAAEMTEAEIEASATPVLEALRELEAPSGVDQAGIAKRGGSVYDEVLEGKFSIKELAAAHVWLRRHNAYSVLMDSMEYAIARDSSNDAPAAPKASGLRTQADTIHAGRSPAELLALAAPYEQQGPDYNRNIAESAARLRQSVERGDKSVQYNADELAVRLEKWAPEANLNRIEQVDMRRFSSDLNDTGVAYVNGDRYAIKQANDGTYYVERTRNGQREDVATGFADIAAANRGALEIVSGASTTAPLIIPPTPAQERILAQLPTAEANEAQKKGLGFDRPQTTSHRLPNDPVIYMDRQGEKRLGYIDTDGKPHMLSAEESEAKRQQIAEFEAQQKQQLEQRLNAMRENARAQDEKRLFQPTPSGPAYYRKGGQWFEHGTDRLLGRKKGDDRVLLTLEGPNVNLYEVRIVSDNGAMHFAPVSNDTKTVSPETPVNPSAERLRRIKNVIANAKLQPYQRSHFNGLATQNANSDFDTNAFIQRVEQESAANANRDDATTDVPDTAVQTTDDAQTFTQEQAVAELAKRGITLEQESTNTGKTVWRIKGKTFDVKDTLKALGAKWYNPAKAWSLFSNENPAQKIASALAGTSPPPTSGSSSENNAPSGGNADEDLRLKQLRERLDGTPDRRGARGDAVASVNADTAALIRRGLKFGMPADVVEDQIEDIATITAAFEAEKPMFLLGNGAGTGKTFVLGGAIRELRSKGAGPFVYVTMNQDLIEQIKKDLADYGVSDVRFHTYSEASTKGIDVPKGAVLIFDEAHNVKNADSERGSKGQSMMGNAKFTIFASATPFENPVQAGYLAGTGIFNDVGGHVEWGKAYGAGVRKWKEMTPYGMVEKEALIWNGGKLEDGLAARQWFVRQGIMVTRPMRLPMEMVESQFSKKPVEQKWVDMHDRVNAAYDEAMQMFRDEDGNILDAKNNSQVAMHQVNTVKRILESAKVDHAIAEAQRILASGGNVVVFVETKADRWIGRYRASQFYEKNGPLYTYPQMRSMMDQWSAAANMARAMNERTPPRPFSEAIMSIARSMHNAGIEYELPSVEQEIVERLGGKDAVAVYTGSVANTAAFKDKEAFLAGKKKVIVATMAKGGTGLSLHDKVGNRPTFQLNINLPWVATGVDQVSGRVARYGLQSKAHINWLFAENIAFERMLANRVGRRMRDMGALVKGIDMKAARVLTEGFDFDSVADVKQDGGEVTAPEEDMFAVAERLERTRRQKGDQSAGFFETPFPLAALMTQMSGARGRMLEPSAGRGNLLRFAKDKAASVLAVELRPDNADYLRGQGINVENADFADWDASGQTFDTIHMNPPFERKAGFGWQDMAHLRKAHSLLAPGGRLVAIIGEGGFFRSDNQSREFREWLDENGAYVVKLPEGAFKNSNTNVRTRMIVMDQGAESGRTDLDLSDMDADSLRAIADAIPSREADAAATESITSTPEPVQATAVSTPAKNADDVRDVMQEFRDGITQDDNSMSATFKTVEGFTSFQTVTRSTTESQLNDRLEVVYSKLGRSNDITEQARLFVDEWRKWKMPSAKVQLPDQVDEPASPVVSATPKPWYQNNLRTFKEQWRRKLALFAREYYELPYSKRNQMDSLKMSRVERFLQAESAKPFPETIEELAATVDDLPYAANERTDVTYLRNRFTSAEIESVKNMLTQLSLASEHGLGRTASAMDDIFTKEENRIFSSLLGSFVTAAQTEPPTVTQPTPEPATEVVTTPPAEDQPAPTMPRDRAEAIVRNLTPKEQAGKLNPKERAALEEARARLEQDDNGFDPGGNVMRQPAGPRNGPPTTHIMPDGYELTAPGMHMLASAPVRAFHGTPHKVDKFTTAKIGTGEGAQAYGWGLYFAESRKVAEEYRKMVTSASATPRRSFLGNEVQPGTPEYRAASLLDEAGRTLAGVRKEVQGWIRDAKEGEDVAGYRATLDALNKLTSKRDVKRINGGNLYTVELLPDESEFLDWDKPLSEQSEKVKKVMAEAIGEGAFEDLDGHAAYNVLADDPDAETETLDYKKASEYLASLGIPGIRYLDGGSRGANVMDARLLQVFEQNNYDVEKTVAQMMRSVYNTPKKKEAIAQNYRQQLEKGKPTRNYVIFDETLVRILEENGKPVAQAPLASAPVRSTASGMASASGAAQANEPSPGGLSEAEAEIKSMLPTDVRADYQKFDERAPILWRGETTFPAVRSVKILGADSSGKSSSIYPSAAVTLANGGVFVKRFRVSDHAQVSETAFRQYDLDYRLTRERGETERAFDKRILDAAQSDLIDAAVFAWEDQMRQLRPLVDVEYGNELKRQKAAQRREFEIAQQIDDTIRFFRDNTMRPAKAYQNKFGWTYRDGILKNAQGQELGQFANLDAARFWIRDEYFKSSRAADGTLASSPARNPNRATQAMRDIIEALPPPHREVLRDLLVNGMSIADAATTHNISETAVGNILRRGEAHIRLMLDRAPTKPTVQVQDGIVKATDGRPDLAMSGNAAVAAVDQRRMTPEEVTHAEMQDLATRLFDVAPAEAESLVVRWMDSGTTVLSTDGMPDSIKAIVADAQARNAAEMMMTAAAKMLVARKTLEGGNSTQLARLIYLYRNTGTEQARALGMRRDPFDTPEERAAMYLSEALLTPPDAIKNELRRNPANRDRILASWAKRADEIKAEMLAHGIDLDATFADHAEEQKLVEETIPDPVKPALARAPKKTRQLVKAILQGMTPAEAIKAAGLSAKAAFKAYQDFRATLNQTGTEAAQAMRDQLLRSAPAPGADFAANLGLPDLTEAEWIDAVENNKPLRTTPETEKLKQHREKAKKAGTIDLKNPVSVRKAVRAVEERKSNAFEKISEFWRASILSGPQTHVVNLVSGLTYGAYEASFKKLAAGVQGDIARMFGAKPDAASLADIPAMIAASLPSIKLAFMDGIAAWKSETRAFENYALQLRDDNGELFKEQFNPALKGTLGKVMRGISFRLMGAADEFVKSFFTRIEVAAQARQIARNEGKTGLELAKAIQELMEPGSLAWERALGQAKKITFQTEIGSGSAAIDAIDGLAQLISRTKKGDFGKPLKGLAHFTFPFVDTPTNIFKAGVTMSPVGGLLALVDMIRAYNRYRKGNTEEAAKIYNAARALDDLTNQIVAWGFILGLSHLVKPGDDEDETPFITGTIPWRSTSPGERELAYRTAPAQSIRIGDRWISYKRLDPFASALAFTVDAIKEFQSGKPIDEVWTKIGLGMMRNMQDKTFLQGVSDVVNAVQDPERFGTKWATNIATGFIPNLIRQPIRTADEVFRETDLPNDLGFWDALGRRMGYGIYPQAAMPAITVWGEPARKDTGTGGPNTDWMLRLLSPADMRAANVDMLDVALLRYNATHQDGDPRALFGVTAPSRELQRTIGGQVIKISLDDAEYEDFITKAGKAARQAIGTTYDGRDLTEQDVDRIKDILSRAHETFRNAAFVQAVQKRGGLNALANTTK